MARTTMLKRLIEIGVPLASALIAVGVLVAWGRTQPTVTIQLRVPGLDHRPDQGGSTGGRPLVGRLSTFDGTPAELPGAWPRFRGARFDNIADDGVPLARTWPAAGPEKLWSIELGEGHAGAAVLGGRVFVHDYDREAGCDAVRCFSLADGKEIWRFTYPVEVRRNHGMSRTVPAVNDKYVVALGPKCHLSCLDPATGKQYWLKDMVTEFGTTVPPWYAGQCPLLDGELAVLAPAGESLVLALDCATGEVVWKSPNPRGWKMTHVSLMPMEFAGRKMYVYSGSGGVAGVSAEDGELLWDTTDWEVKIAAVASPVILPEGRIFCSGGYNSGAAMLQLEEQDGKIVCRTLFKLGPEVFGSAQHTPIFYQGRLFGVREKDKQLVCLDLEGHVLWESGSQHKFGIGPYLLADGMIYLMDDFGVLTLVAASPEKYEQLAQAVAFAEGHDSWGPMAMVHGRLILRDLTRMACLDVAAGP